MAFFNPLGAVSAFGGGLAKGYTEEAPKIFDMMGMQALGKTFQQPMQGPIDAMNMRGGMPSPQPPMPGQPSIPAQPAGGGAAPPSLPQAPAGGPMSPGLPPPGPGAAGPGGGSMMPGGGQMIGGGMGAMPQFDLQTLVGRINAANPGLPPQAMVSALTRAVPLLNVQGRQELALLRAQMQQQTLDLRRDALDVRERLGERGLDVRERGLEERGRQFDTREERLRTQFDENQKRLRSNADRRFEDSARRLDEMTKRRMSYDERVKAAQELRSMEQEFRANHNAIMEQIQAGFVQGADKQKLIDEAIKRRDENMKKIEQYRAKIRGGASGSAPSFDDRFSGEPASQGNAGAQADPLGIR